MRGGRGRRGGGRREGAGGGRSGDGRREKRAGGGRGEEKREGGGKRKILRTRSARRSRREERDEGREGEVRGGRGRLTPVHPLLSNTLSPVMITLLHDNRMLTQWINEIYATKRNVSNEKGNLSSILRIRVQT